MDDLTMNLVRLCQRNRDGSYGTQNNRRRGLTAMAQDLADLGYKLPSAESLKPKHVEALVEKWLDADTTDASIRNRLTWLRWWAEKVNKPNVINRDNAAYGVAERGEITRNRAQSLDPAKLATIECPNIKASLLLQAAFGLRREEAMKFQPHKAIRADHIALQGSWTKGGRARTIPITTLEQRQVLEHIATAFPGNGSLIPAQLSYVEHLKRYEYQTLKATFRNTHGLRHAYTTVAGDVGDAIDCVVTATNANGSASADSNDIVVTAAPVFAWSNIGALFNGGAVDGLMCDLTDKSMMFQDANGAAAVVNNGDPIGLVLDQHKMGGLSLAAHRAAQPEKATNAEFASDISGWIVSNGTGSWYSFSGQTTGAIRLDATSSAQPYCHQLVTGLTIGRWYELSLVSLGRLAGTGSLVGISAGTTVAGVEVLTYQEVGIIAGTFRRFFKAPATSVYIRGVGAGTTGTVTIFESLSLKEIDGHHATQTTAGNRPLWSSVGNDALFNSNKYLTCDYLPGGSTGNSIAAWRGNLGDVSNTKGICGMNNGSRYLQLFQNTTRA